MKANTFSKENFIKEVKNNLKNSYRKTLEEASQQEIFQAVSTAIKDIVMDQWLATQQVIDRKDPKIVYYMSMEFLMGRALGNNMINLTVYNEVKEALEEIGLDLNVIEDQEPDPALGNGGLGRLAACFMDSLASLGYAAYGCGIRYRYGMFKQQITNGFQIEIPDNWLQNGYPFELHRPEYCYEVKFGGKVEERWENGIAKFEQIGYQSVNAVAYDMPIVGYNNDVVDTLIIWDAEPKNGFNLKSFDIGDYERAVQEENLARNLVEVLYPNDNHRAGKELRLKQQYFFVSASLHRAIARFKKNHTNLYELPNKVTFQMNDTHPTVAVAELMRILMDEEGMGWDEAWDITTKSVAYTNHTIMAEALEKWPIEIFENLLPRVYQIVKEIDRRFVLDIQAKFPGDYEKVRKMAILWDGQVKMANMAICAGYSVNGVARLHTEILKHQELKDFYEMFPEKFNNKTNGITQRRFLKHANPLLADWLTEKLGSDAWVTDLAQTKKIAPLADDPKAQAEFMAIKRANKVRLAAFIKEHNGIDVDPDSIFDVQVKRLHEYKRQLMNIMHIMYLYNQLKDNPNMDFYPRTFIFGAKAAAGYATAKSTIKLINTVADKINNDPDIQGKIKVVFIEDYNVSKAEMIVAAADISEQISTASKEASGTGNMKFMANGAITIGTMDGANVEMFEEVGADNIFIFGMSSDEVIMHEQRHDYYPIDIYNNDWDIRRVMNQMIDGTYSPNDRELFRNLFNSLINAGQGQVSDRYFILRDFRSYAQAQYNIGEYYKNRAAWAKSAILNTACVGKFSSDRTIQEYVDEIWKLDKISVTTNAVV